MAGHSHWAGIKHKKGRQDKLRSQIFSKISREITVAAKLGSKDPQSNPRLRAAIETAKDANMPKDNINRAISKSEMDKNKNYENLRYEGFGPKNIALIIETFIFRLLAFETRFGQISASVKINVIGSINFKTFFTINKKSKG